MRFSGKLRWGLVLVAMALPGVWLAPGCGSRTDIGETDEGEPFLVMQLLHGKTLAQHLNPGKVLPVDVAVGIACDVATGEVRRFLTGPVNCELTGATWTPDGRTMFVNIQHPGEPLDANTEFNDPAAPQHWSTWPDGPTGGRPRSATLAIRRSDGGLLGS